MIKAEETAVEAMEIVIKNVGPNGLVTIPLAPGGGVTVLRGRNDRGKSEALKAVSVLAGGKDRITVKRDAPEGTKGEITGGGVRVAIHRNIRRTGEAEFEVLDGDLSIEDIVDPGIKDPVAADAKRIKALLRVANASIEPEQFYPLVGGAAAFCDIVSEGERDDPLLTAQRVRAWLQKQAREAGTAATEAATKAEGIILSFEDTVDDGSDIDQRTLEKSLELAITSRSRTEERIRQTEINQNRFEQAQKQLAAARAEYTGPTVDEVADRVRLADSQLADAVRLAEDVAMKLRQAKEYEVESAKKAEQVAAEYERVTTHERTISRLAALVEQGRPKPVGTFELDVAETAVEQARLQLETASKIRQKRQAMQMVEQLRNDATAQRCLEDAARSSADSVNGILCRAVESLGSPLFVDGDRVCVKRDGQPAKEFDELSVGARRKIALDIAIDSVGTGGLIPLKQENWEGWDHVARREINDHLKLRGVNMVTAEADKYDDGHGGNVRAEIYKGERP